VAASPLDDLALVSLDELVLHETIEPLRAERVRAEIARAGVLADPVVVTPAGPGRWLVLDGAHRTAALRSLGMRSAVVQVMTLSPAGAHLDSWAHDLPVGGVPHDLDAPGPVGGPVLVARVGRQAPDGTWADGVPVTGPADPVARAAVMSALARRYAGRPYRRAVPGTAVRPGVAARVRWAPWSAEDLLTLITARGTLPAGTTRFVLPGRVLGVRVGLSVLAAEPRGGEDGTGEHAEVVTALRRQTVRTYTEAVHVVEAGS